MQSSFPSILAILQDYDLWFEIQEGHQIYTKIQKWFPSLQVLA